MGQSRQDELGDEALGREDCNESLAQPDERDESWDVTEVTPERAEDLIRQLRREEGRCEECGFPFERYQSLSQREGFVEQMHQLWEKIPRRTFRPMPEDREPLP